MATRRKKKSSSGFPSLTQWMDHPFKSWKRAARKIDVSRAAWLKEKNEIKADRAKAKLTRDTEVAKKRQQAAAKKTAKETQARARKAAAESRAQSTAAKPTVVRARVAASAPRQREANSQRSSRANSMTIGTIVAVEEGGQMQRFQRGPNGWHIFGNSRMEVAASYVDGQMGKPNASVGLDGRPPRSRAPQPAVTASAASSVLCGSRETDDGKPCRNPSISGPCAAGHKPANKPQTPRQQSRATWSGVATRQAAAGSSGRWGRP